jgi:hypothetical protein
MTQLNFNEDNDLIPLLPFYVYVLMHPFTKEVIYVGKGKGTRMQQHSREVKLKMAIGENPTTIKHQKIKEIMDLSGELLELVVARFETECEAFAVESTLIKWVYGFDALTNAIHGHGSEFIREKNNFEQSESLDMPAPVRVNDGSYRDANITALQTSGAYALLMEINNQLKQSGFDVRDFSAAEDRAFLPGESNGILALMVRIKDLDFIVSFSKSCTPSLTIANTLWSRREQALIQMNSIYEKLGGDFLVGPPKNIIYKNQGRYRDFITKPKFSKTELQSLYSLMRKIKG